jgi:microcystin degradation protein MlrC
VAAALLDGDLGSVAPRTRRTYRPIAEAIAAARAGTRQATGPLVVADGTDNPGGGGYNDAPNLRCCRH